MGVPPNRALSPRALSPTMGHTTMGMTGTWGSTFDSTAMYGQLLEQSTVGTVYTETRRAQVCMAKLTEKYELLAECIAYN